MKKLIIFISILIISSTAYADTRVTLQNGEGTEIGTSGNPIYTSGSAAAVQNVVVMGPVNTISATSPVTAVTGTFWPTITNVQQATAPVTTINNQIDLNTLVYKSADINGTATATPVWIPATGKKFVITDLCVSLATGGIITIYDGETNDATNRILKLSLGDTGGAVMNYQKPRKSSTNNNVLRFTSENSPLGSMSVQGYEE